LFQIDRNICELWLDGGWDRKPENWGIDQVYKLVKEFNPACAVGVNGTIVKEEGRREYALPGKMTEDNKYYFQYFPSDMRLWDPKIITMYDKKQYLHGGQSYYLPFEHTICLSSRWNWFQKSAELPVRELDELQELFYWCTQNNNSLVINVPPDNTGRIREYEANAVITLGQRLGLTPGKPLPKNGQLVSGRRPVEASSMLEEKGVRYEAANVNDGNMDSRWSAADSLASLEISLDPALGFNKISIFEYKDTKEAADGFSQVRQPRILAYNIQVLTGGKWETVYLGDAPMGDCKVIRLPRVYHGSRLKLNVLASSGLPSINEINVFRM
jgi:alpha-L-fucosidase